MTLSSLPSVLVTAEVPVAPLPYGVIVVSCSAVVAYVFRRAAAGEDVA